MWKQSSGLAFSDNQFSQFYPIFPSNFVKILLLGCLQFRCPFLNRPPTTLNLVDSIQRKAIVGDFCLYFRYVHGLCSNELSFVIPCQTALVRQTRNFIVHRRFPFPIKLFQIPYEPISPDFRYLDKIILASFDSTCIKLK